MEVTSPGIAIAPLLFLCIPILFFIITGIVILAIFLFKREGGNTTPRFTQNVFAKANAQRNMNDAAPQRRVDACVVAKRTCVQGKYACTTYYATFQTESGDRMELVIPNQAFGYLIEGDRGKLTFQGNRFLMFEREV